MGQSVARRCECCLMGTIGVSPSGCIDGQPGLHARYGVLPRRLARAPNVNRMRANEA
jgi:hypothetical protein